MKALNVLALSAIVCTGGLLRAETVDASLFVHQITIQFSGCSALTPLENFPVAIKLSENVPMGFSYADCAVDGFRFTDAEGNVLPHDVETWDPSGTSYIWVNVPSLVKDQVILLHYGAAVASLPVNTPSQVWSRADYVGVWHMAEASGAVADAAGNNLTATHKGTVPGTPGVAGVVGTARCTATSAGRGYLTIPNYDALGLGGTFTISGWLKESAPNGYSRIFSRKLLYTDDNGWEIEMSNGSKTAFTARAAKNDVRVSGNFPDLTTDWRLLALAYEGTSLTVFGDGVQVAKGSVASTAPDNGQALSFGCDADGNEAYVQGSYDEVRLRRVPSTAAWLTMEYESARNPDFAILSPVDQTIQNSIGAAAQEGGLVKMNEGEAAASVQSEGVALGTSLTATLTAIPQEGYHFMSWSGNVDKIVSGTPHSQTITVSTTTGAALSAIFISKTGGGYIEITNAFDHPSGGFMTAAHAKVPGSVFSNLTDVVIAFTAPDQAPSGLREFIHANPSNTGFTDDWGYFRNFELAQSATTQTDLQYARESKTTADDNVTCTYAGSWYVPTAGTYSFRMSETGPGQVVIDNRIVLQQKSAGKVVSVRDVALTAGWHNLYVVLKASGKKIGPVGDVAGILYSAANADLAADPSAGSPFATEEGENAHRLSTAYNGVFVPSLWAAGGNVILDCANALGDLRLSGQWGTMAHAFAVVNLSARRTLEIGRPANLEANGYQSLDSFAYVDWNRTTLPEGVNVRLEGAVALDHPIPTGHDWSLGTRATLATTIPDFFGVVASGATEFVYPSGLLQLYVGNPTVLGDVVTVKVGEEQGLGLAGGPYQYSNNRGLPFRFGSTTYTFRNPVEVAKTGAVNMTAVWDSASICGGSVMGKGEVRMTGWGRRMTLGNAVVVDNAYLWQRGNRLNLRPVKGAVASRIGTVNLAADGGSADYTGVTLFYCPQAEGEPPLGIGTLSAANAEWLPGLSKFSRARATLSTCSNNTVNVSSLKGVGVHLRTWIPAGASDDPAEGNAGAGNFVVGSIDAAMKLYVSTNVNLTVTNVAKATEFHYEVMSNGVNAAVLDIEETCTPSKLSATDIAMLPARVKGFVGEVTLTETAAKNYPITVDFSRTAPILGGCDGSGTLVAAPANGVIDVSLQGETPKAGDYGLARFTAGGGLLANWTVNAPTFYQGYTIAVVKDATGLWLKVRKGGAAIYIR